MSDCKSVNMMMMGEDKMSTNNNVYDIDKIDWRAFT